MHVRIVVIAAYGSPRNIYRYRLLNVGALQVFELAYKDLKERLEKKEMEVEGLKYDNNRIVGTTTKPTRLPLLDENGRPGKYPGYTVIYEIKDYRGYIVSNYRGNLAAVTRNELIGYGLLNGLTNARIIAKPGMLKVHSDKAFEMLDVDDDTKRQLEERYTEIETLNKKLAMLMYPYVVVGNTIHVVNRDVERVNIVEPVEYLHKEAYYDLSKVRELKLPRTFKEVDLIMLFRGAVKKITIHKSTKTINLRVLPKTMREYIEFYE